MTFKEAGEILTIIAAFLGMGLSIYNFFVERSKRKLKIEVQPKAVIRRFKNSVTGGEGIMTSMNEFNQDFIDEHFAIEVINLSSFPVVIDSVGFEVRGNDKRMVIVQPIFIDDGKWPRKLDQRESVTVYGSLPHILRNPGASKIMCAFVETSCGEVCRGTSAALSGLVEYARKIKH